MNRAALLEKFLGGHPNSSHPFDIRRFVEYAVRCAEDECSIDDEEMLSRGVSIEKVQEYRVAYSWIRETFYLLNQK